ncbi:MAG: hypothetical protein IPK14_23090 [Blastocatellia bacterium]|nr:hypothetical protein [Blastocatellia bacterium]
MSENPIREIDLDSLQKAFISYLQGVPLASVKEFLSLTLRVEDPIYFPPKDVAQIVTNWALLRSNADGYLVHEYYLRSIELIAAADHSRALDSFDPSKFYMPYFEGLVRSCPKEEKEAFRQKLKTLRERLASEWGYQFRRLDTNEISIVPSKENTSVKPIVGSIEEKLTYSSKEIVNSQQNVTTGLYAPPENLNQPQPNRGYYPPPATLANNALPDSPVSSFSSYPNNTNPVNAYPSSNNYGQLAQSLPASPMSSFNSYPKANVSASNYPIAAPPNSNYGQVEETPNSEAISSFGSYPTQLSVSNYGKIAEPPAGYTTSSSTSSFSSKRNDITAVDINNLTTYEVIFDLADTVDSFDKSSQTKEEEETQATPEKISAKIHKLRMSLLKLSVEEQDSYIAELQSLIFELATKQLYLTPYLEALIDISITSFNAGQGVFGAQLLYIVEQVYYLEGFDEKVRYGLRKFRAATELSEPHMRSMSSDPALVPALRIYLAHFDELAPDKLLENLIYETDRQKQRFWMLLIEAHKETATSHLLQQLSKLVANNDNWPMIRNLIAVIGRIPPQERIAQRQAIGLLGNYLKSLLFNYVMLL